MWTVVYMTPNRQIADNVQKILEKNTLITRMRSVKGDESRCGSYYELLVPESELQQALSLIIDANF